MVHLPAASYLALFISFCLPSLFRYLYNRGFCRSEGLHTKKLQQEGNSSLANLAYGFTRFITLIMVDYINYRVFYCSSYRKIYGILTFVILFVDKGCSITIICKNWVPRVFEVHI